MTNSCKTDKTSPYFFLGVDGGGTNCRLRLCDIEGQTIGEETGGPANITRGLDESYNTILSAVQNLIEKAGLSSSILGLTRAGLGLAGIIQQHDIESVCSFPHPFHSVCAESDAAVACIGAHGGNDGGIIILGTGSHALAFYDGERISVGGWGFTLSDHGSGAQLGLQSIRLALLAHECERLQTPFTREVLARFGSSPIQLFHWSNNANPADYGEFAKIAAAFAAANDSAAIRLLKQSAKGAETLIQALIDRNITKIVLYGGMASVLEPYIDNQFDSFIHPPQQDALSGAIQMAMKGFLTQY
jgi:glucosamine kinase